MGIGAINRPLKMELFLRRAGRFDRKIDIGVSNKDWTIPNPKLTLRTSKLGFDFDLESVFNETNGFVGSDLNSLHTEAAI